MNNYLCITAIITYYELANNTNVTVDAYVSEKE